MVTRLFTALILAALVLPAAAIPKEPNPPREYLKAALVKALDEVDSLSNQCHDEKTGELNTESQQCKAALERFFNSPSVNRAEIFPD